MQYLFIFWFYIKVIDNFQNYFKCQWKLSIEFKFSMQTTKIMFFTNQNGTLQAHAKTLSAAWKIGAVTVKTQRWMYEVFLLISFMSYPSFCDSLFLFFDCKLYEDGETYLGKQQLLVRRLTHRLTIVQTELRGTEEAKGSKWGQVGVLRIGGAWGAQV